MYMPKELRKSLGLKGELSVGLESANDLIKDVQQALKKYSIKIH